MLKIQINTDKFLKMKALKQDVVHLHRNKIYKYSPETEELVKAIESFRSNPVFKHISVPTAYLYDKKQYFGYIMKYYRRLHKVQTAIRKGIVKDIEQYALELLAIIEELNKLNLCYWDFHFENIYSDRKGHPFILDIDDIELCPTNEDLHNQKEYLTEFLLCMYLGQRKSVHAFARQEAILNNFSDKTLEYIDTLGDLSKPAPDLPYCIIEELHDKEKRDMIKSKIK